VRVVHPLVPPLEPGPVRIAALRAELLGKAGEDREVVILQASRLDQWKGHRNLLRALYTLRELHGWRCWIAGAPQRPEEETYKRELLLMADEFGIADRVSFIGHRDDMPAVLAACDIYCQPNETAEPFGMVFVEALYAGKPVVGSALGGTSEIVTEGCGMLCPPDPALLAVALRRLIEDEELRAQMSRCGPGRAAELCGPEPFSSRFRSALEAVTQLGDSRKRQAHGNS